MTLQPHAFLFAAFSLVLSTSGFAQTSQVVAPKFAEYSVTFPEHPKTTPMQTVARDGQDIQAIRVEVLQGSTLLRAEFAPTNPGLRQQINKEFALAGLKQYALHNGIEHPEFFYEKSTLGPTARLRGTKILNRDGKDIAITIETRFYYGDSSVLSTYAAAPSTEYPSQRITRFLDSVRATSR